MSAKTFRVVLLGSLAALAVLSGCKKAPPTLSLLVWEGYADPSFIQGFEAKCQCKVTAAYMGSSDELVAKLRGGAASNYDVISPSSDVATGLTRTGLVAPLDLSKIPNYAQLSPSLTSRTLVKQDGKVYGVPLTWGPNPLLYDTTAFAKAPTAWAELWDPKYANKLSFWDDLSTMYMAAEVLGFGKPDPTAVYHLDDAQRRELLTVINEETDRLDRLVDEATEMAQLDAHKVELHMAPVDIAIVIEAAVEASRTVLGQHPFDVRVAPSLPEVRVDSDRIAEVLKQLLENAAKYSSPASPITITTERKGDRIVTSVTDHGPGIDDFEQSMVFDKFYRGRDQRYSVQGTGMGLAIAKAIVEAHNGVVGVTSQLGRGSVVSFDLPAA